MQESHTVPFGAGEHHHQTALAACGGERGTPLTGRAESNGSPKATHTHGSAGAWEPSLTLQLHPCQRLTQLFLPSFHFCELFDKTTRFSVTVPNINSRIRLKLVIQGIKS